MNMEKLHAQSVEVDLVGRKTHIPQSTYTVSFPPLGFISVTERDNKRVFYMLEEKLA